MAIIILKRAMAFFLEPGNGLVVVLALGAVLLWTRWRSAGVMLTSLVAATA